MAFTAGKVRSKTLSWLSRDVVRLKPEGVLRSCERLSHKRPNLDPKEDPSRPRDVGPRPQAAPPAAGP